MERSKKNKPVCFISYCREDADKISISLLVNELKSLADTEFVVLWDEEQRTGSSLKEFMDQLHIADVIVVLLSPAYRRKVDARTGYVYEEYQRILGRRDDLEALRRKEGKAPADIVAVRQAEFSLLPYIFVGTGDTACPVALSEYKYSSLTQWHAHRDTGGRMYIPDATRKSYRPQLMEIVRLAQTNHSTSSPEYSETFDHMLSKLFRTVKHEDVKGYLDEDPQKARHLFVKTHAYNRVKSQDAYILTGRKGTGKTTLTEYLAKWQTNKYKAHSPIKIDDFELESISEFLSKPQVASDTTHVIRRERVFRVAWEVFIHVHCMETIIREQDRLSVDQARALPHIIKFVTSAFHHGFVRAPLKQSALYRWALTRVAAEIDKAIAESRNIGEAEFLHDVDARVSNQRLVEAIIPKDVMYPLSNILRECKRRFLISLDGFDRNFDEFRRIAIRSGRSAADLVETVALEKDWVRSLLYLCREVKNRRDRLGLFQLVDFCVTLPKDRCMEILRDERDTIAYMGRIWEIKWTGIELAIMLRKRLEILFDYCTSKDDSAVERVIQMMAIGMPKLSGATQTLFISVLRHTFWRPRDVLMYFAALMTTYRLLTKRGIEVDETVIRKKISETKFEVIDKEFIAEFQTAVPNIAEIIRAFKGMPQILSADALEVVLAKTPFEFADTLQPVEDVNAKVVFLFEIGFLGLRCSDSVKRRFELLLQDVFYFNDGRAVEKMTEDGSWRECEVLIHPVFSEYLNLIPSKQPVLLEYTWDYLRRQDALEGSAIVV